jgi:hypothetical protein
LRHASTASSEKLLPGNIEVKSMKCDKCGKELTAFDMGFHGRCRECVEIDLQTKPNELYYLGKKIGEILPRCKNK